VCGVYSDVTNGGKTAKALFETERQDVLWTSIPVEFYDRSVTDAKVSEYRGKYPFAKVSNIDDHIDQTFGSMKAAVQRASYASAAVTILLSLLVTSLFMKMLVTKDRHAIAFQKSVGFTVPDIRRQYLTRSVVVLILGVIFGTVLSNTLGELVGVALISSFGASTFHFHVNPLYAYLLSPLVITACVYAATLLGVAGIRAVKVSEHIKEL
jgi:putative ABC transport system permease protein